MNDQRYMYRGLEDEDAPRHASQYSILQPQFLQQSRSHRQRDSYRATPYDHAMYDGIEEDDQYEHDAFDSFDQSLLQHPYEDRQRQAAQGRARLSLAPGPSKFFKDASASRSQLSHIPHDYDSYSTREHQDHAQQSGFGQLSRLAYNRTMPQESSSDTQLGPSSSPALRAGQRRGPQDASPMPQSTRPQLLKNEGHCASERRRADVTVSTSSTLKPGEGDEQLHVKRPRQEVSHLDSYERRPNPFPERVNIQHGPPLVQGIRLVPVAALPDRLRNVFPFPNFNAIQSKSFEKVFKTDDNFVLASPTGSGKTAILELAICRAFSTNATDQYKIVYQAPTKALCSERQRDWEKKFNQLGLSCAELTGDSDATELRNIQSADIIITTPEKWDSITRKWKDHQRLMNLVKLFLIDEVHILKEDRGAVLEAAISRMKSIGTDVRFVALSATVPNLHDIAAWLGKSTSQPSAPAASEKFGEEFRPVKLRKHVCGYVYSSSNDFAFERMLDSKLPDVIAKYSEGKPMMIFCPTRKSTISTANLIANWWASYPGKDRIWKLSSKLPQVVNKDLRGTLASGVAFHHAGLDLGDRMQVEKGFLSGEISVICCTSTLAVGVNLPCHLVIVKNTLAFTTEGLQEYSDLEMMQMLGRAGRPQFDDSAVAVIMTRHTKVQRYEMMATGQEVLESKLHLNFIDHMNAEIGLGTIRDMLSARKWLSGTFLYVRLQQNPAHYKLDGARSGRDIQEQVDDICFRDITLLRENSLVSGQEYFQCTEFGHAMARYYVRFETMKLFIGLQSKCSPSEILSAIAQANEFSSLRFRQGEKALYKILNRSPSIRWSIPVNLDLPSQKVSLIIQSILGSADISWEGELGRHKSQYLTESQIIFKNVHSLIRCIIDCQIYLGDSISIHSALLLERSLGSQAWDDSPLQMRQIYSIGAVAVRKLVNAGIRCMDDLEGCEAHRIEVLLGRNPPYGLQILEQAKKFPKLRVSLHAQASSAMKTPDGVKVQIKADIGFMNDAPPQRFGNKLVYVCVLVDTSDGRKIHFARISGPKLGLGQTLVFPALLTSPDQIVNCYVMCDGIAGSMREATVKPQITSSMFPMTKQVEPAALQQPNVSKRRIETTSVSRKRSITSDDFGDDEIDDDELVKASFGDLNFDHIENYANPADIITRKNTVKNKSTQKNHGAEHHFKTVAVEDDTDGDDQEPVRLANGKWACNHKCKDKKGCKHLCCKDGTDKPPKKKLTAKRVPLDEDGAHPKLKSSSQKGKETQTKLRLVASKRKSSTPVEELDLTQQEKKKKAQYAISGPKDFRDLHQLHKTVQGVDMPSFLHSVMHKKPSYCYSQGGGHNLSFMDQSGSRHSPASSDYGDVQFDELSLQSERPQHSPLQGGLVYLNGPAEPFGGMDYSATLPIASRGSDTFGEDDSLLGKAMVGLADSHNLQTDAKEDGNANQSLEDYPDLEDELYHYDENCFMDTIYEDKAADHSIVPGIMPTAATNKMCEAPQNPLPLFANKGDQSKLVHGGFRPAKSMMKETELEELGRSNAVLSASRQNTTFEAADKENYEQQDALNMANVQYGHETTAQEKPIPEAFKDLEPWLFQEFGDIVEFVDE